MSVPFVLLIASLAGLAAAFTLPHLADLVMLAGPAALASLFLLWRARTRPAHTDRWPKADRTGHAPRPKIKRPYIVVDGSNVMYWKDNTPQIDTLREVIRHIESLGYTAEVVFDANAGYKISGKYQHDYSLGKLVGLPADRVLVVPKGSPADPFLLEAARDLGARIVTNDRFRDWADHHPEIHKEGHLIKGHYTADKLHLNLAAAS